MVEREKEIAEEIFQRYFKRLCDFKLSVELAVEEVQNIQRYMPYSNHKIKKQFENTALEADTSFVSFWKDVEKELKNKFGKLKNK